MPAKEKPSRFQRLQKKQEAKAAKKARAMEKKQKGHQRTKDITKAILQAKKRDGYLCRKCKSGRDRVILHGAHCLVRNCAFGDPRDVNGIVTLCWSCHTEFDKCKTIPDRAAWMRQWVGEVPARYIESAAGEV